MLDRTTHKPFSGAVLFPTADAMMEAILGPQQHDAHVSAFRHHAIMGAQAAWLIDADQRVADATAKIIARMRSAK